MSVGNGESIKINFVGFRSDWFPYFRHLKYVNNTLLYISILIKQGCWGTIEVSGGSWRLLEPERAGTWSGSILAKQDYFWILHIREIKYITKPYQPIQKGKSQFILSLHPWKNQAFKILSSQSRIFRLCMKIMNIPYSYKGSG